MDVKTRVTIRAIKAKTVADITGDSIRTIWRRCAEDPTFPKPFKLSVQSTVWDEGEVVAWLESKKAQRSEIGMAKTIEVGRPKRSKSDVAA